MRERFISAADTARTLLDHPDLALRWDGPSVLESMTVGELTAHLSRAVTVVPRYLSTEGEPPYRDAPGYFLAIFPTADPDPDSETGRGIRSRAVAEAAAGPEGVKAAWDGTRADLEGRLVDDVLQRGVAVAGSSMRVADYLVTRMVELVVHADDLAASLDAEAPTFAADVTGSVLTCLVEMAARRHSPLTVIRALSRTERGDPSVLRVF